jgi:hypothetical protein
VDVTMIATGGIDHASGFDLLLCVVQLDNNALPYSGNQRQPAATSGNQRQPAAMGLLQDFVR